MYSFQELKRAAKAPPAGTAYRLAVLGNSATQMLSTAIKGYGALRGIPLKVLDVDYNQIDQQLLDPQSETYRFAPNGVLLYLASEKLYEEFMDMLSSQRPRFAELYRDKLLRYWELIDRHCGCDILQFGFVEIEDRAFGNYSCKMETSFTYQMRKLGYLMQEEESRHGNIYPVDLSAIQNRIGRGAFFSRHMYYASKLTIAIPALPEVAKQVVDIIRARQGKGMKCIVLDLDNTLWGGVIGDDGMGGIEIGELGRGHVFTNFQRWLKQLKERGLLLAVCSKNDDCTAREPFEKHPEMVLRLEDISLFVANWEDKASNIAHIQKALNLGMDSFVFLDDNAFERNLVRSLLPEVTVPELPEDPAQYLDFLQRENLFEAASFSEEDSQRTKQYRAEFARQTSRQQFATIDEYLRGLMMVGSARPFDELHYARIAQLTQRSNQFNLRTVRYTEEEIARIAKSEEYVTRYFTLQDKFGDHGLVSVVILKRENPETASIDTWLMSCRVLKRGMEEFVVNGLVTAAKEAGIQILKGEYIPTKKNAMVEHLYVDMGFTPVGENQYILTCEGYQPKHTYIIEAGSEKNEQGNML